MSWSETTYGEPAGLFGINCGHHPMLFIPGATMVPALMQSEQENAEIYALNQKQRRLERDFRKARLEYATAKAQGVDEATVKAAQEKLKRADERLDRFETETGRRRRREREYGPASGNQAKVQTPAEKPLTDGGGSGTINIEVDELTPCLRKNSTGELVDTTIQKISPTRASTKNWEFDWTKPERSGFEVYALRVKGERTIQGMIALKDDPANYGVKIDIVEAAPQNNPHNPRNTSGEKEYNGVGGHLFAEACRRSFEKGYGGFVHFIAKTKLVEHYQSELGAELLNPRQRLMAIDGQAAAALVRRYFGGGE